MTLQEIKEAVRQGKQVKWASDIYDVRLHHYGNGEEQWLVTCKSNNRSIGLTWADGETLNGKEEQFYTLN